MAKTEAAVHQQASSHWHSHSHNVFHEHRHEHSRPTSDDAKHTHQHEGIGTKPIGAMRPVGHRHRGKRR